MKNSMYPSVSSALHSDVRSRRPSITEAKKDFLDKADKIYAAIKKLGIKANHVS